MASKYNIPEGKTYYISKEEDGTISLILKIEDYFSAIKTDEYILASHSMMVCPITISDKKCPYFVEDKNDALKPGSEVNTKQVYSLDYSTRDGRNLELLESAA